MSVFDQTTGQETQQTQPKDYVAEIASVKGEQFKDPQVLAKSKLEADQHILNLENQLKELREDLSKQEYSKTLLEALQNKRPQSESQPVETKTEVSEDILKALVEKTLTQREADNTAKQNLTSVNQKLDELHGTNAKSFVLGKAAELGMTVKRLEQLAAESPTAFFTLIGEPAKQMQPIVKGSVNTASVSQQSPGERDWFYYQKLRKENPSNYYSPAVQKQLLSDKLRLGPKFGNT